MPYSADLRCSYLDVSLNVDWFYESQSEFLTYEFPSEHARELFEKELDNMMRCYIVYKLFGHKTTHYEFGEWDDIDLYADTDGVWGWLADCALLYQKKYPDQIVIRETEDEVE